MENTNTVSVSLTTRERGAYIRVEKRVTDLGGLYSEELIHMGGGLFTEFYSSTAIYFIILRNYNM